MQEKENEVELEYSEAQPDRYIEYSKNDDKDDLKKYEHEQYEKAEKIRQEKILEAKKEAIRKKAENIANRPEIAKKRKEMIISKVKSFASSAANLGRSVGSYKPQGMQNSGFGFSSGMNFGNPMAEFSGKSNVGFGNPMAEFTSKPQSTNATRTKHFKKKIVSYVKHGKHYKKHVTYKTVTKRVPVNKPNNMVQHHQSFGFGNPMAEFMKPGKKVSGMGFNPMAEFMPKKGKNRVNTYKWW